MLGIGTFFLHPAADIRSRREHRNPALSPRQCSRKIAHFHPSTFNLVYRVRPNRLRVIPLRRQLLRMSAVDKHGVYLRPNAHASIDKPDARHPRLAHHGFSFLPEFDVS